MCGVAAHNTWGRGGKEARQAARRRVEGAVPVVGAIVCVAERREHRGWAGSTACSRQPATPHMQRATPSLVHPATLLLLLPCHAGVRQGGGRVRARGTLCGGRDRAARRVHLPREAVWLQLVLSGGECSCELVLSGGECSCERHAPLCAPAHRLGRCRPHTAAASCLLHVRCCQYLFAACC